MRYSSSRILRLNFLFTFLASSVFLLFAFFLQHMEGLEPCVKCVDTRVALFGVALFSLIGSVGPRILSKGKVLLPIVTMLLAYTLWTVWDNYMDLYHPSGFMTACSLTPAIASIIPVDTLFPWAFEPKGMCSKTYWQFAGMNIEVVFATLIAVVILLGIHIIGVVATIIQHLKAKHV